MDRLHTLEYALKELRQVISTLDDTVMDGATNCQPWTVRRAFDGHEDQLAPFLGAPASTVVRNADLSFSTRLIAERAQDSAGDQDVIDQATGLIAASFRLDLETAAKRLESAAGKAGLDREKFARGLVGLVSS